MVSKPIILSHHGSLLPNLQWDSQDSYPDKHAPTGEIYSIQFNSIQKLAYEYIQHIIYIEIFLCKKEIEGKAFHRVFLAPSSVV